MTQKRTAFFPCIFVILEFLQRVISICRIFFLTWAHPSQCLVHLQDHRTHLLKLEVTFVKKWVCALRSWVHGKGWSQAKEESDLNTEVGWSMTHLPEKLHHWVLPWSHLSLSKVTGKGLHSPVCTIGIRMRAQAAADPEVWVWIRVRPRNLFRYPYSRGLQPSEGLPAVPSCQAILLKETLFAAGFLLLPAEMV